MKVRRILPVILLALGSLATPPAFTAESSTEAPPAAAPDSAQRTLTITVIEPANRRPDNSELYHRLAQVFPEVFEARQWPVTIDVERFGANSPNYDLELRVFLQEIREESRNDLTFRAWMNLHDNGKKHDLGVITYRHYPRAGKNMGDVIDDVLRGAAREAAKKIEPVLFPHLVKNRDR